MKKWRDLLYFSQGERRALIVLLALLILSTMWLQIGSNKAAQVQQENDAVAPPPTFIVQPDNAPKPMQVPAQTKQRAATTSFPAKQTNRTIYPKTEKYPAGTVVELNTADTTSLKKVPGIGSTFARRIVGFRQALGGFYSVSQLREVHGMDEERYQTIHKWFAVDTSFIAKLPVNDLPSDSLSRHPYMSYQQARAIYSLRRRKGRLHGWDALLLLNEFSQADRDKLQWYLAF